jgi:hypothetical protein
MTAENCRSSANATPRTYSSAKPRAHSAAGRQTHDIFSRCTRSTLAHAAFPPSAMILRILPAVALSRFRTTCAYSMPIDKPIGRRFSPIHF